MKTAFRTLLTGDAAITTLVPVARINWVSQPQGAGAPYVTLHTIGGAEDLTMQGPDGLLMGRVQVDCYGETAKQADDVAQAIVTRLHGYRDTGFRLVTHVATRDSREGGTNEAERLFRVSLDFTFAWRA